LRKIGRGEFVVGTEFAFCFFQPLCDSEGEFMNLADRLYVLPVLLGMSLVATFTAQQAAASTISVEAMSGRTFLGEPHERTDDTVLWIESRVGSTSVQRPVRWDRIVKVTTGDAVYSAVQYRTRLASGATDSAYHPPERKRIVISGSRDPGLTDAERVRALLNSPTIQPPPKVSRVGFAAQLANWDRDIEIDGFELSLWFGDAARRPVAVRGQLDVTVYAIPHERLNQLIRNPSSQLKRIGRWSKRIEPGDFVAGGARYELPWNPRHIANDSELSNYGVVVIRVGIPGQGVFERQIEGVRIREFSLIGKRN